MHTCRSIPRRSRGLKASFPESTTPPLKAYRLAREAGMDFVAITDHDSIDGALEVAHLPHVVVGEEITARFPADGTVVHVVALGLNEATHRLIQEVRDNVYELVAFLHLEGIFHFVAHPLYRGGKFGLWHFEQLLLLFKAFETLNGGKQVEPPQLLDQVLDSLTPRELEDLASKYGFAPYGVEPWCKTKVGGSDDHCGVSIGSTFTLVPKAQGVPQLLEHLKRGAALASGRPGSVSSLAAQILGCSWNLASSTVEASLPRMARGLGGKTFLGVGRWAMAARERGCLAGALATLAGEIPRALAAMGPRSHGEQKPWAALAQLCRRLAEEMPSPSLDRPLLTLVPLLPLVSALVVEFRHRPLMRAVRRARLRDTGSPVFAVFTDATPHPATPSLRRFLGPEVKTGARLVWVTPAHVGREGLWGNLLRGDPTALVDLLERLPPGDVDRFYVHTMGSVGILGLLLGALLDVPVVLRVGRAEVRALQKLMDEASSRLHVAAAAALLSVVDEIRLFPASLAPALLRLGATEAQLRCMGGVPPRTSRDLACEPRKAEGRG